MTSTPDSILIGVELQGLGDNTNTWGYQRLNNALTVLAKASQGYIELAITGSTTVSDTNYSTTNTSENAVIEITGSLSAAATITMPSRERRITWLNSTAQAVTVKCSGGTGISIPAGYLAVLYCDGVDYYNAAPQLFPGAITVSGQVKGVSTGTASTDAVNLTQMETAIANASIPAAAGTVLVSANDTTAGYLGQKIAVAGDLALSVQNSGADEDSLITHTPYWNATRSLAFADSPITALDRDVLRLDTSGGAITVNLPASGRVWVFDATGDAAANNITLVPAGADTITFNIIDSAYFGAQWLRTGTLWDLA